ncbi:alpha-ketoglutarate dehydrogenase component 4-like [Oncorhynchus masou masou]|uniref:alpha-ketoglutarate dehydrogenase component 4-like n=1 Tax=Oncorhynchus masou masou TaxID=90313 RepID=UPI003183F115
MMMLVKKDGSSWKSNCAVQEVLKVGVAAAQQSSGTHSSPLTHLPGTSDTAATIRDLPQRYRRRIVGPEEMEYIQRGGPE